jgi:hypothetical protein
MFNSLLKIALKQERTPKEDILDLNTSSSSSDPVAPATHSAGKQDQTTPKELAWLREKNTTMHQILCLPSKPGEGSAECEPSPIVALCC